VPDFEGRGSLRMAILTRLRKAWICRDLGERRDSNPRPPGPQPGTRFASLRLVFRSTPLHTRPSGGSRHEARLRRSRSIPGDPVGFGPNPGSWAPTPAEAPCYGRARNKRPPHIDEDRRPGEVIRSRSAWERTSPPMRCALLELTSTHRPSPAQSPLSHLWGAIPRADLGRPARRCRNPAEAQGTRGREASCVEFVSKRRPPPLAAQGAPRGGGIPVST
jgi:hypothetical protein